ncbi:hypothetical protein BC830DRAFT_134864 [Chytriomyces sp. MP71]|nr:hypothetical protein BC830DRAFT_134864 [Chytriomyces sp. MP71]
MVREIPLQFLCKGGHFMGNGALLKAGDIPFFTTMSSTVVACGWGGRHRWLHARVARWTRGPPPWPSGPAHRVARCEVFSCCSAPDKPHPRAHGCAALSPAPIHLFFLSKANKQTPSMFLEPPSCFLAHDEFGIAVKSARGRNETLAHVDVEDAFGAEARIVRVAPGVVGGGPVVVVAVSVPVKGVSLHVWDPVNLKMHHLAILDSRANKSISLLALAECDVVGSSLDGTYSWLAMQRDTGSKLALYRIRKKGGMPEYIVDEQPTRYDWCLPERVTCVSFCVSTSEEDRTYAGEPLIFFGTASGEVGALRLTSRGEVERVKELTGMKACDAVTAIAYDISQNGHIVLFVGSGAPKSRANLNIFTILASSMSLVVSQQCLYSTCNGRTESLSVMRGDSGYRIHCLCVGTRGCQAVTVRVCGSDVEVLGAEDWSGRFPDVTCVRFTGINGDLQVINDMACTFVHTAHPIERAVIPALTFWKKS